MAGVKIIDLPAIGIAQGTDVFPVSQSGVTYKESNTQVFTYFKTIGEALTRTSDTNVTLTLGGSPTTALLNATSITAGWTGELSVIRGGTGVASFTAYSVICGGIGSTNALQSVVGLGSAGQQLTSNGAGALPTWQSSSDVLSLTGTPNQVLVNGSSGVPVSGAITLTTPQDIGTASSPTFENLTLTTGLISGSNLNSVLELLDTPSSTNHLIFSNNTGSSPPGISSTGVATNIGINLTTKGNSGIRLRTSSLAQPLTISSGTGSQHSTGFNFPDTANTWQVTFQDSSGTLAYLTDIPSITPAALTKTDDTNVTLTLGGTPTTALLQATSLTLGWTGILSGTRGGTGVNNSTRTITIGGNLTTSGAFNSTFTMTNTTAVTFPTSGTLATTAQIPTGAALTKVDDANVTLTLGGSPTTALVNAASLTLGWTGQLVLSRGGSGASLTASNGGIVYSTASAMAILAGTATAGQIIRSGASAAPSWSTTTYPATNAVNTLLYASSANVMAALATANSSVLVTDSGGIPSLSTALPANLTIPTPTISGNATFSANTAGITGIINGAVKAGGVVGEILSQIVTSPVSITSTVVLNVASVVLTAGNWSVSGELWAAGGATASLNTVTMAITTVSATLPSVPALNSARTGVSYFGTAGAAAGVNQTTLLAAGPAYISVTTNTTVYMVAYAVWSGTSSVQVFGKIVAERQA